MKVLPPLPKHDYLHQLEKAIKKQNDVMSDISSDIKEYFAKALYSFAKSSPEELDPIYESFINSGVKFANSFSLFVKKIQPTLNSIDELEDKFALAAKKFSQYQDDVKDVRSEPTPENIEKEKNDLLTFVEEFQKSNSESNSLLPCFLVLYIASCTALADEANTFVEEITSQVEQFKKPEKTKEEIELEETIKQLELDVQKLNEQKAAKLKAKQDKEAGAEDEKAEEKAEDENQAAAESEQKPEDAKPETPEEPKEN